MSLSIYYSSLAQKIWESFWKGAFLWWVIIICHSSKIQVLCWMKWPGKFFMTKFQHSSGIHLGEILKNFPGSFHLSINIFFLKSDMVGFKKFWSRKKTTFSTWYRKAKAKYVIFWHGSFKNKLSAIFWILKSRLT